MNDVLKSELASNDVLQRNTFNQLSQTEEDIDQRISMSKASLGGQTGMIFMWSGNYDNIPDGYLLCDGSAVNRNSYQILFGIIGTNFGSGDGISTFNLPNLVAKFPRGIGTSTTNPGATGGADTHTLTIDEIPSHSHAIDLKASGDENNGTVSNGSANDRTNGTTLPAGGGSAHNNLPSYLEVAYIIKT